jgi:hypothetical protein
MEKKEGGEVQEAPNPEPPQEHSSCLTLLHSSLEVSDTQVHER